MTIVPVRHPWRWVASVVILVFVAMLVNTLLFSHVVRGGVREGRFQWGVVGHYLFVTPVLRGIEVTLELTVIAMIAGVVIGILLAVMRLSPSRLLSGAAWVYIWFFRGTPVLVQLFFWYLGIAYLYQHLTLGVPFGPALVTFNSNTLITTFVAGALGLSFNEGAYMAEIVRAGIISVDEGQSEAAASLGMSKRQMLRRIILPHRQRDDLDAQDHVTRLHHRRRRPFPGDPEHRLHHLPGGTPPHGGKPLVPALHLDHDDRPVLRGAVLRPGLRQAAPTHTPPAAPPGTPPHTERSRTGAGDRHLDPP